MVSGARNKSRRTGNIMEKSSKYLLLNKCFKDYQQQVKHLKTYQMKSDKSYIFSIKNKKLLKTYITIKL